MTRTKRPHKRPVDRDEPQSVQEVTEVATGGGGLEEADPDQFCGVAYTVTSWKGLPNYECRFCAMALLDQQDAIKHFEIEHCTKIPEERIVDTGLVDEDGSKIVRVIPAEEV